MSTLEQLLEVGDASPRGDNVGSKRGQRKRIDDQRPIRRASAEHRLAHGLRGARVA